MKENILDKLQKSQIMQSLLPHTVLFLLALIFAICTTLFFPHLVSHALETYSLSVGDLD